MEGLIDTHIHLTDPPFASDDALLVKTLQTPGIETMIVPGYSTASCRAIVTLKHRFPHLPVAIGIHPCYLESSEPDLDLFFNEIDPVAVGEIGLDRRKSCAIDIRTQISACEIQLQAAMDHRLPVIMHCVGGHGELLALLSRFKGLRGVLHRANCSLRDAEIYLEHGFYFGFGPDILRSRRNVRRHLVSRVPIERILVETDCPFTRLPGGAIAMPVHLPLVVDIIAGNHGISPEKASRIIRNNTIDLFRLFLPRVS